MRIPGAVGVIQDPLPRAPPPVLRLAALLALAVGASAQTPPAVQAVPPDSAARPAPDSLVARAAPDPLAAVRAAAGASLAPRGAYAPYPEPLAGVVWTPPADRALALDDLLQMRRAGVRAVRTEVVHDTLLLRAADLLGLAFYQDLPVRALAAPYLLRRQAAMADTLRAALRRGAPFASARWYGLARASDTSERSVRPYFESLTAIAREAGARTYYLTRFPTDDRASQTVDLVLLDARGQDPVDLLRRFRVRHDTPAGLGSYGLGVDDDRDGGWRVPDSPAAQARALETQLADLASMESPPAAAFVHRWRDLSAEDLERDQRAEASGLHFGLLSQAGEPRPALDVLRGVYTGTQRTFAFDAGAPRDRFRTSPLLILGWLLVLGVGLLTTASPKLSTLAPRYFRRHDLYREAVERGFALSLGETALLAVGVAFAFGIVGAAALRGLAGTDALLAATAVWSPDAQARLTGLVSRPLALVLVLSLAYGVWFFLNLIWMNVLSGKRRIRPAQALSVAAWSRWAWLALSVPAVVLGTLSPRTATAFAVPLLVAGIVAEIWAGYRTMTDFAYVSRVPYPRAVGIGFGLPLLLLAAGLVAFAVVAQAEAEFLLHLATRN